LLGKGGRGGQEDGAAEDEIMKVFLFFFGIRALILVAQTFIGFLENLLLLLSFPFLLLSPVNPVFFFFFL